MWIADLSPYADDLPLLSVGFLAREQVYQRGEVSEEFFTKLCALVSNAWNPPVVTAGVHFCELCRFTGGSVAQFQGYQVSNISNRELFVPGDGFVYVAPISITHYVDAHEYYPPFEFQEAVLRCPPMRSAAYFKALLANGARELIKAHLG